MFRPSPAIEGLESRRLLATLPAGFAEQTITTFTDQPTSQVFTPDGRLFVTLEGTNDTSGPADVRVIKNGAVLPTPLLTVTTQSFFERGLLGIALHPSFNNGGFVYVYYTVPTAQTPTVTHRVERWNVPAGSDVADPASRTTIFDIAVPVGQSSPGNHNGGAMAFGPDGKLYIAVGDNANSSNAQNLTTLFGKMLRINEDGSIPVNPFDSQTTGLNKAIYAMGLRNPFTFAFKPGSARFHINDVGSSGGGRREEVNVGDAGAATAVNYGWPLIEGFRVAQPLPTIGTYRDPIHAYTDGFAITGGAFYNPANPMFPPQFIDKYFFGDYVSGTIRRIDPAGTPPLPSTGFATGASGPVDLDVSPIDGSLWYIEYSSRNVKRVFVNSTSAPTIQDQPQSQTVSLEEPATFTVAAAGPSLAYQWQRNGQDIPGANSASYTVTNPTLLDNGAQFRVIVSNSFGTLPSSVATLTVLNNHLPDATIETPVAGTTFVVGTPISFSGSASDMEDGTLGASAFAWEIRYTTGQVTRPPILNLSGVTGGQFVPEVTPAHRGTDVTYEIVLRVTDSAGGVRTVIRVLQPVISNVTLATNVPGLTVEWDGSPFASNYTFASIVGREWSIGAPPSQVLDGQTYEFQNWSDGGAATHNITVLPTDTTYTATYEDVTDPVVLSSGFVFSEPAPNPPHQVRFSFSENVSASLTVADLTVMRLDDNTTIPSGSIALQYRAQGQQASFRFPGLPGGVLPDGNYRATLSAAGVTDAFGNALPGDAVVDFFVFAGDANHDRTVNIADFSALAANFNQPGTFEQGDFNYSGTVEIGDFSVLASRFNTTLQEPRTGRFAPSWPGAPRPTPFSAIRLSDEPWDALPT
jgi:glucose/arabinose dehydrogenase